MNKVKTDTSEIYKILNALIKDNKIKFKFNNNNLVPLDPISVIKNNTNNTIEIEFRNVVKEHLEELKSILNKKE